MIFGKVYYLDDSHFRETLEYYLKKNMKIAAGYDGEFKMYYIKIL